MHFTSRPAERYLDPRHLCYLRVIFYYWFFFFLVAVENICPESGSVKVNIFLNNSLLNTVFSKNSYNADFVERNTYSNTDSNTQTNVSTGPVTTATIPYIRGTSEIITRLLHKYNLTIYVFHTLRRLLMSRTKTNRRTDREPKGMQDQMLRLSGHLHWWNRQKPKLATDWTQTSDKKWWRKQWHYWRPSTDETSNRLGLCDMYYVFYGPLPTTHFRKLGYKHHWIVINNYRLGTNDLLTDSSKTGQPTVIIVKVNYSGAP